jgi:Cu(I)/Ag(I) efflux system membrane protein CusA/SilA
MSEMDAEIRFPGLANAWTMPIKTRIDMLSTGIKTPVGIKISGPDLAVLQQISKDIEQIMKALPDTLSAFGDRAVGGYFLDFDIDREQAARHGLTIGDIQDVIMSAIGGMRITETVEGLERYPVNLRYPRDLRANIEFRRGAPVIKSENARPNAWVYVDLKTSDVGGFVAEARKAVSEQLVLPPGYAVIWSGQYEYMERAAERLRIVIPMTLFMIFLLLYLNFGNASAPAVVMLSVPFALIGGFWLVYWYGFNISVAVAVGFIALAGVAVETGVLVLTFIEESVSERRREKLDAYQLGKISHFDGRWLAADHAPHRHGIRRHAPNCSTDGWRHAYDHSAVPVGPTGNLHVRFAAKRKATGACRKKRLEHAGLPVNLNSADGVPYKG